jgi:hypothetical protein
VYGTIYLDGRPRLRYGARVTTIQQIDEMIEALTGSLHDRIMRGNTPPDVDTQAAAIASLANVRLVLPKTAPAPVQLEPRASIMLRAAGELLIAINEAEDERVTVNGERLDDGHARDLALGMIYDALRGQPVTGWHEAAAAERIAMLTGERP